MYNEMYNEIYQCSNIIKWVLERTSCVKLSSKGTWGQILTVPLIKVKLHFHIPIVP